MMARFKAVGILVALGCFAGAIGCTDRIPTLSGDDPLPGGVTGTTIEYFAPASDILVTANVYDAATSPDDTPGLTIAEQIDGVMTSHALATFGEFPDTIEVEGKVDSTFNYETSRVVSLVPPESRESELGPELLLWTVEQPWDTATVSWDFAVDQPGNQVPWTEAGGTRGELIGAVDWVPSDSVTVPDSLVWHVPGPIVARLASGDLQGLMVTAADGDQANISTLKIIALMTPSFDPQAFVERPVAAGHQTFVFTPEAPSPEDALSVGGVRSDRTLLRLRLPETLPGCQPAGDCAPIPLEDVALNRVDLVLDPMPVAAGFGPVNSVEMSIRQVLEFELGPRAPLGELVPRSTTTVESDVFAGSGDEPVLMNVRELVQRALSERATEIEAAAEVDRAPLEAMDIEIDLAIVVEPEASHFGFAWFTRAPQLRFVYTLPTNPELP